MRAPRILTSKPSSKLIYSKDELISRGTVKPIRRRQSLAMDDSKVDLSIIEKKIDKYVDSTLAKSSKREEKPRAPGNATK